VERLLDEPVEPGRQPPVGAGVLAQEEEIRGPLVVTVGKLVAPLGDETLEPAEPPAPFRIGFRLRLRPGVGLRLGLRLWLWLWLRLGRRLWLRPQLRPQLRLRPGLRVRALRL
jgi:hypothetical protein